jgi:hypothetical protein
MQAGFEGNGKYRAPYPNVEICLQATWKKEKFHLLYRTDNRLITC